MKLVDVLRSDIDQSINFIFDGDFPGYFESRYVRRTRDYFICYLSSQSGCNQGCRQCHLTQTKQTQFIDADIEIYKKQAEEVFKYYSSQEKAEVVHFSFMVRGEIFDNKHIVENKGHFNKIVFELSKIAHSYNVYPRFCFSTIMPKSISGLSLANMFGVTPVDIYYSLYSVDERWKKKWMPQAMPVYDALSMLKDYQDKTRKIIKIHFPFIKGENDSVESVSKIIDAIKKKKLRVDFNIVRYNPFGENLGEDSDETTVFGHASMIQSFFKDSCVRVVPRVGKDIYASCGMFVS